MNLIAHRGLHSKNTKENTLEAIELGNKHVDIDGVEIDVRLSKDNKVVVIHDEYIDVVSNGRGRTNEMSLERLKRFNYGTVVKPSTINSLSEVLDKISPQTLLIIELKDEREKNDILASKVIEIVNNYPLLNIWLKSFSLDIVNYLKRYSNRPVGILINEFNKDLLNLDFDFYSISQHMITNDIVNNKLEDRKAVMVWTINTKKQFQDLKEKLKSNINKVYIISDNPLMYCRQNVK